MCAEYAEDSVSHLSSCLFVPILGTRGAGERQRLRSSFPAGEGLPTSLPRRRVGHPGLALDGNNKGASAALFFFRQPSVTPRPGLSFSHCFRIFVIASQWLESGARSTRVVNINPFSLAVISKVPAVCVASCS